jgi:phage tail sheath gpL-like
VTLAIAATTAGTTNPTLTNLIAAMADTVVPDLDAPVHRRDEPHRDRDRARDAVRADPAAGRRRDHVDVGHVLGAHDARRIGRNSPHSSIVAQAGPTPLTPPMEFAAETAALVAFYGAADPARPFQTLAMSRAIACPENDLWFDDERNLFLLSPASRRRSARPALWRSSSA